jgi:hypothetical protein
MQERDAHVLADKVRRLVQGARGVQAVTPVHTNPQMDAHGWTVRVARAAQHGGDVRIFGSDHGGFRTMEQAGSAWALDVLVRRTFFGDESTTSEQVWPSDATLGKGLRDAASQLRTIQHGLTIVARDLETRRQELPWVVVSSRDGAPVVFLAADRSDAQHIAHDEIAAGRSPFHLQAQLAEVPRAD